jgi:parvulin-like peptidyl-prolyl isomerase
MKTGFISLAPRLLLTFTGLCATGLLANATEASAVARVGSIEIKTSEIRSELESLDPSQKAILAKDPALLNQAVRSILVRRLVLQEAQAKKWQSSPEIARQLEKLRETAITESYLQSVSTPAADFPSDADLNKAYEENKSVLIVPRQLRLSQIFIALPRKADKAAEEKAQSRLDTVSKKLKGETPFPELVGLYSDEKSGAKESELGWIAESLLQPAIREGAKDLAKGGVSRPIRMDDGWHIVKVLDSRDERTATFDEVKEQLRQRIRAERQRIAGIEYVNNLLKANPVSINELELTKVLQSSAK